MLSVPLSTSGLHCSRWQSGGICQVLSTEAFALFCHVFHGFTEVFLSFCVTSASDSPENTKSESPKVLLSSLSVQHTSTGLPVDYGDCYLVNRPCLDCRLLTFRLEGPLSVSLQP